MKRSVLPFALICLAGGLFGFVGGRLTRPAPVATAASASDGMGLASFSRDALASLAWADDVKRPGAATLSAVFSSAAASASSYPTPQAMSDATAARAKAALGGSYPAWRSAFLAPLRARADELSRIGRLETTADLAEAYREVAAGLDLGTEAP